MYFYSGPQNIYVIVSRFTIYLALDICFYVFLWLFASEMYIGYDKIYFTSKNL